MDEAASIEIEDAEKDVQPGDEKNEERYKNLSYLSKQRISPVSISTGAGIFRLIRLISFLQIIALFIDHPSIQLPGYCHFFLKGPCFYILRFFSKPFADILYILRSIYLQTNHVNFASNSFPWLNTDITDGQYWHSLQHFGNFFLAMFFCLNAAHCTLYLWEISDVSDHREVRHWRSIYVDTLWLLRGGSYALLGLMRLAGIFLSFIFIFAYISTTGELIDARLVGGALLLAAVVVVIYELIAIGILYSTRQLFLRYASQNADHTSAIVLKEVLKTKTHIGLMLCLAGFTPAVFFFTQSIMGMIHSTITVSSSFILLVITDWNDEQALPHRVRLNYYAPCYLMGFPPYRFIFASHGRSCPAAASAAAPLPLTTDFYRDNPILICDSSLGISVMLLGCVCLVTCFIFFGWMLLRLINDTRREILESSYVKHILSQDVALKALERKYIEDFKKIDRWFLAVRYEGSEQMRLYTDALAYIGKPLLSLNAFKVTITALFRISSLFYSRSGLKNIASSAFSAAKHQRRRLQLQYLFNASQYRPSAAHLVQQLQRGPWRRALKIEARYDDIKRLNEDMRREMKYVCLNFGADHSQVLSVLDRVINSAGPMMLFSQFRWRKLFFFMVFFLELFVLALISAILKYYCDWDIRGICIAGVNSFFGIIVYVNNPFIELEDRWMDHMGRVLINVLILGLIVSAKAFTPEVSNSSLGTEAMMGKGPASPFDVSDISSAQPSSEAAFIDALIVIAVYLFTIIVLIRAGLLSSLTCLWDSFKYSFNSRILDFVVKKLSARTIGAENIFTGLGLAQQWDDIIQYQRRHGLMAWPEAKPSHILTEYEKIVYIQWASLWDIRIPNLKSSLGLSILHVSMSEGNSETSRWLIHRYPALLKEQDLQKDTPLMLALKEAAKYLIEYSKLNMGYLDDGSSFEDDYFHEIYPDYMELREECREYGEFLEDRSTFHSLDARELNLINDEKRPIRTSIKGYQSYFFESSRRAVIRYPEDSINEDRESGLLVSWGLLDIEVPTVVMYADSLEDSSSQHSSKTRFTINISNEDIIKSDNRYKVPLNHPDRLSLPLLDARNEVPDRLSTLSLIGRNSVNFLWKGLKWIQQKHDESTQENLESAEDATLDRRRARWNVCKFSEILLSSEARLATEHMEWDITIYKHFNQMANKLQGKVSQHLAYVCNMNPPDGFAHLTEWSEEIKKSTYDDGGEYDENIVVKAVVVIGKAVEAIGDNVDAMKDKMQRLISRRMNRQTRQVFSDRTIHFLSECLVCSSEEIRLNACQLSNRGAVAWRAICRALRRKFCSFILPSTFVHQKCILIRVLALKNNGLDCADCILLSEVVKVQQSLIVLEVSYNKIGSRGMLLLIGAIRGHRHLRRLLIDHNRIGPAVGSDLENFIANNRTMKYFDLSHNRLGPKTRYPTGLNLEHIPSSGSYIFRGLRLSRCIEYFDISYNNLGPSCMVGGDGLAFIQSNTSLHTLIISGNDLGPIAGPNIFLSLAGCPIADSRGFSRHIGGSISQGSPTKIMSLSTEFISTRRLGIQLVDPSTSKTNLRCRLRVLIAAENQLGVSSGESVAMFIRMTKTLTTIDISQNAIGATGGALIAESIRSGLQIREREIAAAFAAKNLQIKSDLIPKKNRHFCLSSFRAARNCFGAKVCSLLMDCLRAENSTLIDVDISSNALGSASTKSSQVDAIEADIKSAMTLNRSIAALNISDTGFTPVQIVAILGGIANHNYIVKLCFRDVIFDSPCSLQISRVIDYCPSLRYVNFQNGMMGPHGASLVCTSIERAASKLDYVNICNNKIGSTACIPLSRALSQNNCSIKTLLISKNDICDDGCVVIAKSLLENDSLTELDISCNGLSSTAASQIAVSLKGKYFDGKKVANIRLVKFKMNDNPLIDEDGAVKICESLMHGLVEYADVANIGAGYSSAAKIATGIRDLSVRWRYLNCSGNRFGRSGLNSIFWSLRVNRRLRVALFADSRAGQGFGVPSDALGIHGVSLDRAISENCCMVSLSLCYNNLSSEAGIILFESLVRNGSLRRVHLRGNLLDDEVAESLQALLASSDMVEELDIGENKLGSKACVALSAGLTFNSSLHTLFVDKNRFGTSQSGAFSRLSETLAYNTTLKRLHLDSNRIGPDSGCILASGFARNSTLIYVSMKDNRLDSRSGAELVTAYKNSQVMVFLYLSFNEIGSDAYEQLVSVADAKLSSQTFQANDDIYNDLIDMK